MNRGVMFDDRSPIYRQIADQIRTDVLSGALEGDEQVMSTNQYAAYYRINPATAAKAFQHLVDEGVLYKRRGVGMFVSPDAREALRGQRRETFFAEVVDPMVAEARAVGVPLADVIARIGHLAAEGDGQSVPSQIASSRVTSSRAGAAGQGATLTTAVPTAPPAAFAEPTHSAEEDNR